MLTIKPIENCYWIMPGRFLAGEYPRSIDKRSSEEKISKLIASGITRFIDLTTKDDALEPYEDLLRFQNINGISVERISFPIPDVSVPTSPDQMRSILQSIDYLLVNGHGVYVHCWGGVGRTGVVVGCWLKRHFREGKIVRGLNFPPIGLDGLWKECPKSKRKPMSPETEEQQSYINDWPELYDPSDLMSQRIETLLRENE